ncbi:TRAP transporter substrate-binding protein DctP [Actinophytocola sp.]|uniref:TRAP transporter substrate-binding protein DctP n=1 Tax=Actinophytocola sp. TaxID=1872138 RepID=UPI003D6C4632
MLSPHLSPSSRTGFGPRTARRLAVLLVPVALAITACGGNSGGSGGAGGDTLTITYVDFGPSPDRLGAVAPERFMDLVEERSDGKIKFERTYGGTLVPEKDQLQGLKSGVYQMGYYIPTRSAATLPVSTILDLPFLLPNASDVFSVGTEFITTEPSIQQEWESLDATPFFVQANPPVQLLLREKPSRLSDLGGLTLRSPGASYDPVVTALGATPVNLSVADIPTALSRGTIDGTIYAIYSATEAGLAESAKSAIDIDLGGVNGVIYFAKSTYDSLSSEQRDLFEQARTDALEYSASRLEQGIEEAVATYEGAGGELLPDLGEEFAHSIAPDVQQQISQEWLAALPSGVDGKALIDKLKSLTRAS